MLLFSWCFAEVSPAGNRAAPAGETHFPDLNSCGARTELAATPALRCGQSAERKLEGPPVLDFPRSGGDMFRLQERSGRPQGWTPKEDFPG